MSAVNQMQGKVLAALHLGVAGRELEWIEVQTGPAEGTVRIQRPGRFRTLLRLDYEFAVHCCRILVYRDGNLICGRSGISYDDGDEIEKVLSAFDDLLAQAGTVRPVARASGILRAGRLSRMHIPLAAAASEA
jgi:hypothetical protein